MQDQDTEIVRMPWHKVCALARILQGDLVRQNPIKHYDRIIAIARGGAAPAVVLSHLLGIRRVEFLQLEQYTDQGNQAKGLRVLGHCPEARGPSGTHVHTLIVDDLIDSGRTMNYVRSLYPAATCAVLVSKKHNSGWTGPILVGRAVRPNTWIDFPWEGTHPVV